MSVRSMPIGRRRFLGIAGVAVASALVAACSTAAPAPAPTQPAAAGSSDTAAKPTAAASGDTAAKPNVPAQAPAASGGPIQFTFWSFPVGFSADWPHGKWEAQKVKEFEEKNPGVKIEYLPLGWEALEKLATAISSGAPPDMQGRASWSNLYTAKKAGVLQEVELTKDLMDDLPPGYYKSLLYEGKNYLIPWYVAGQGARVNLSLAKAANAEDVLPKGPAYNWDWDQFLDFAKKVASVKTADGKPAYAAALFTQTSVPAYHWITFEWIWNMGGEATKDGLLGGCASLSDEAGVKALQYLQDLYYVHKVIPNPASIKDSDVSPFWIGNSLGYQTGVGLSNVRAKDEKADKATGIVTSPQGFEWRLVQNPTAPGVKHQGWGGPSIDVNLAIYKQKNASALEKVTDFGHYIVNKENQSFIGQFVIPVRTSVVDQALSDDPWAKYTVDYLVPNARGFIANDLSLKLREVFHNHFQELFIGGTPKKAKDVAKEFDEEARRFTGC